MVDLNYNYPVGYERYFLDHTCTDYDGFSVPVLAVTGNTRIERMRTQSGAFTLHRNISKPLEEICPAAVQKIVVPRSARQGAIDFLWLTGVNEYSVFANLDDLSQYIHYVEIEK